jgi:hypothetical protein
VLANHRCCRKGKGYTLSGILVCDHCGKKLVPFTRRTYTVYKCSDSFRHGGGGCPQWSVREDEILPFLLRMLGQEIKDLKQLIHHQLLAQPPEELARPASRAKDDRVQLEKERKLLVAKIDRAEENLMNVEDPRTLRSLDQKVKALRDRLDALDKELATTPTDTGYRPAELAELAAFSAWWEDFDSRYLSLPVPFDTITVAGGLLQDWNAEEAALRVDPKAVREALLQLGCEVRLRWQAVKTPEGYPLSRGRFRLGQESGQVPLGQGVTDYGQPQKSQKISGYNGQP